MSDDNKELSKNDSGVFKSIYKNGAKGAYEAMNRYNQRGSLRTSNAEAMSMKEIQKIAEVKKTSNSDGFPLDNQSLKPWKQRFEELKQKK